MLVLLGIGFAAGVITAISPCVLPVLPIVLAGSASGGRRRPFAIIAGLTSSFAVFTLFAAWILDRLGLPPDFLRNLAIALLFLLAASLVFPQLAMLLERPFARFGRMRRGGDLGGGFLLGASLGLAFVPCAGPVLGAIVASAATLDFGVRTIALTIAYSAGIAVPMVAIATAGQRAAERTKAYRLHARELRAALGVVIAAGTLAIVFHLDTKAQTALNDYTGWFQGKVERSAAADRALAKVVGPSRGAGRAAEGKNLDDFGAAPDFHGIAEWLNTPEGRPLSIRKLRGKVVLVDFWTYTCINCIRTLPHVEGWYGAYRRAGLVVVGVHTPEFAFEHVPSNVRDAVHRLEVEYPVALDNDYATWNAYSNRYWPAKYLIDRRGHVRYAHFGEGSYDETESVIRTLLAERARRLPDRVRMRDPTPEHLTTPETYLGYSRFRKTPGVSLQPDQWARYPSVPNTVPLHELAFGGIWRIGHERAIAGRDARLRLHFYAQDVFLVLSGHGRVRVSLNGGFVKTVGVDSNRLYTLLRLPQLTEGMLDLRFTPGLSAYAFTFG